MGRKTTQRKRPSAASTQTKSVGDQAASNRWINAFDSNDHSLALVRSGIHGNTMRIVDVQTGTVRSEYTAPQATKIISLNWAPQQGAQSAVALGLQNGTVQVYSPSRNMITKTLENVHQGHVVDVQYTGNNGMFSLDDSGVLVQWDLNTGTSVLVLRTGMQGANKMLVSGDLKRVVVASHRLDMFDLHSQQSVQAWPGHTSTVHSLMWAADETLLVSAAEGDRHVHVWDASSPQATTMALAVLALDCDVQQIDVSINGSILAIGSDGALYAWHQVAVARRTQTSKDTIGYSPDGCLRMVSSTDQQPIKLQLARFSRVSGDEGNVLVVRGSTQRLLFENLAVADEHGHFVSDLAVERAPADQLVNSNKAMDTVVAYSEANAQITTPMAEAVRASQRAQEDAGPASPTLADRVRQLSVDPSSSSAAATAVSASASSGKMTAGSLVRVLVQALHTSDDKLLDQVLSNSSRTKVLRDTVLGLPIVYVLPLIQQLFLRFHSKPSRANELLPWIRSTLFMHSAYLTSLPNLVPQLSGFYQGIEARLESHQKLLKLSGRLELASSQIKAKSHFEKERSKQEKDSQRVNAMRPINVYKEDEEDDGEVGEPQTPVWLAEESTDDEDVVESADEKEQWSDESDDESDDDDDDGEKQSDDEGSSDDDDEEDEDGDVDLDQYD
ncbi:Small subunit (SSU) processome component [Coemansia sp. RSA 1722]|nr:Small subunit (SSU) processome component [Coemansia sp. RSA 486]KAJ2236661.1 Small subunit (SSU) processome component [Coemansia sp. RSA 485]KAJ2591584.1 Small subunit (SSU) processome component [Coemansia sp. RSA 1722]